MKDPWVYTGETSQFNIEDMTTDRLEVLKYIKDIDTSKASAVPNLASKILKPALIALIDQITFIFNLCLRIHYGYQRLALQGYAFSPISLLFMPVT